MDNKIRATVDSLKGNPIFVLSESSKELYHSNFLAWLLGRFPKDFCSLFGDFDAVSREKKFGRKSVDIALHKKLSTVAVIEVKIKDILTDSQAALYENTTAIKHHVSLFPSPSVAGWRQINFKQIANILEKLHLDQSPESSVIKLYVRMLNDLLSIVSQADNTLHYKNMIGSYSKWLEDIRLSEAWKRHFGTKFLSQVKCNFENRKVSINNKSATITFGTLQKGIRLGVQIEGKQLRRFAEHSMSDMTILPRLVQCGWFDASWRSPKRKLEYCTYKADQYVFKYQWKPMELTWTPTEVSEYLAQEWEVLANV